MRENNIIKKGEFYVRYKELGISCNKLEYIDDSDILYLWLDGHIVTSVKASEYKLKFNFKKEDTIYYILLER